MKTMAQIIGEPDDPILEAVRWAFSMECGRIDQAGRQRTPLDPISLRRMEWEAAKRIVAAYRRAEKVG